jgi:hypothetical protein
MQLRVLAFGLLGWAGLDGSSQQSGKIVLTAKLNKLR